jgi:hypothetical protein
MIFLIAILYLVVLLIFGPALSASFAPVFVILLIAAYWRKRSRHVP